MFNKKAIQNVISLSLLLLVIILAFSFLQNSFNTMTLDLREEIDFSSSKNVEIYTIKDGFLYLKSNKNVSISKILVGNYDCSISGSYSNLEGINISSCLNNLSGDVVGKVTIEFENDILIKSIPLKKNSFSPTYSPQSSEPGSIQFNYSGSSQFFTVPAGVTQIQFKGWAAGGGGGGDSTGRGAGGAGAFVQSNISVTPGVTYTVIVGQGGQVQDNETGSFAGSDPVISGDYGSTGGGFSGFFSGSTNLEFNESGQARAIVIAGGGGSGSVLSGNDPAGYGGPGGGLNGSDSVCGVDVYDPCSHSGKGGNQTSGGAGGGGGTSGNPGLALKGGIGVYTAGGGGYFGGGGDGSSSGSLRGGGGGGSGYCSGPGVNSCFFNTSTNSTPTQRFDSNYILGIGAGGANGLENGGNGLVLISWS